MTLDEFIHELEKLKSKVGGDVLVIVPGTDDYYTPELDFNYGYEQKYLDFLYSYLPVVEISPDYLQPVEYCTKTRN